MSVNTHPLDKALSLTSRDPSAGLFAGATSPDYWNFVGPFGGTTAAVMLQAVLQHPDVLGVPVALTVNYAAAVVEGPFEIRAVPVRTNRSTQHWTLEMSQTGADGQSHVNTTGTAFTALRRDTWSANELPLPEGTPAPLQAKLLSIGPAGVEWIRRYEMRPVAGAIPTEWDGRIAPSETRVWLRDTPPRPLDFPALAALSDSFFPRVWLRRATPVPIGTVSISTYFHVNAQQIAAIGSGFLLGRATGQQFANGFFDQAAQLWSEDGTLVATSSQIVYYKE